MKFCIVENIRECEVLTPAWINIFTVTGDRKKMYGIKLALPFIMYRRIIDIYRFEREHGYCVPVFLIAYGNKRLIKQARWERYESN